MDGIVGTGKRKRKGGKMCDMNAEEIGTLSNSPRYSFSFLRGRSFGFVGSCRLSLASWIPFFTVACDTLPGLSVQIAARSDSDIAHHLSLILIGLW